MRNGDLFPLRSTSCHGTTETGTRLAVRRLLVRNCTDHGTTHLCDVHLDLCDVDARAERGSGAVNPIKHHHLHRT